MLKKFGIAKKENLPRGRFSFLGRNLFVSFACKALKLKRRIEILKNN